MGWLRDRLYRLWGAWSMVQDREDEVWNATLEGKPVAERKDENTSSCSAGEKVPDLAEIVARRNEELRRNSH